MIAFARHILFLLIITGISGASALCNGVAFPGAEGFGANSRGGRGGKVILVTNLNDDGPGSLRAACTTKGPRTVVFEIGGIIRLNSPLIITEPYLTVAGQTAPGDGICVTDFGCIVESTHDIVIRYMRFRPGDTKRVEQDALWIHSSQDVIIDHCSTSWGTDEVLSVTGGGATRVSVQWCMITESLNNSVHHKGPHGYGSLIRLDGDVSLHHNLFAHNSSRNPRPGCYGDMERGSVLDFRNNVVYNWGERPGYTAEDKASINYVANVLRPGPSTQPTLRDYAFYVGGIKTRLFMGNNMHGEREQTWELVRLEDPSWLPEVQLHSPLLVADVHTDAPRDVLACVLADVGATLPLRDAIDARIVKEAQVSGGRIIDSQTEVGGLPVYRNSQPRPDSDKDGMPDAWEVQKGLNPQDAADGNLAADGDSYTHLEQYLNSQPIADTSRSWARRVADSFLLRHPGGVTYDSGSPDQRWNYEQGLMLVALQAMSLHTSDAKYSDFVRENLDRYIEDTGTIRTYQRTDYNLDNIGPGRALLAAYRSTALEKYRKAADTLRSQLREQPRTNEGGFWHKKIYPNQMWLDGLFMAEPFYALYAQMFNEPESFDDIADQFIRIARHTRDPKTGLLYHGWDESKQQKWADRETGCSPSFWGRSMGWYAMGLVDVLDYFPADHPKRAALIGILIDLANAIEQFKDKDTRLWYQVVDQGPRTGNYLETSASCMFAYVFAKGANRGYLEKRFFGMAEETFSGIIAHKLVVNTEGIPELRDICRSAGLGNKPYRDGSFEYYIGEPLRTNDMKGIGAFLLAAIQLEQGRQTAGSH